MMHYRLRGERPDWSLIQQCIKYRDLDNELEKWKDSDDEKPRRREVIINLSHKDDEQRSFDRRNRRSAPKPAEDTRCFKCNRRNHIARDCRWTLGLCVICGKDDHFIRNCPNKRPDYVPRGRTFSRKRSSSVADDNLRQGGYQQRSNSVDYQHRSRFHNQTNQDFSNTNNQQRGSSRNYDNNMVVPEDHQAHVKNIFYPTEQHSDPAPAQRGRFPRHNAPEFSPRNQVCTGANAQKVVSDTPDLNW